MKWTILGALLGSMFDVASAAKGFKLKLKIGQDVPEEALGAAMQELQRIRPQSEQLVEQIFFKHGLRIDGDTLRPAAIPAPAKEPEAPKA